MKQILERQTQKKKLFTDKLLKQLTSSETNSPPKKPLLKNKLLNDKIRKKLLKEKPEIQTPKTQTSKR